METCPYCGQGALPLFKAHDRNKRISNDSFPYFRCASCRLIFLHPVPPDLGIYYSRDYYSIPASKAELEVISGKERFKLDLITPFIKTGRLLEIGPAFGTFAYLAKQSGFDVDVIEMDSRCCEFLRDTAGIAAIESADVSQALRDKGPYDVIVLWHVIEHLPNFHQTLDFLANKVRKKGILVIAAPNPVALQFRILGRYWTHVDAPRHVVLIPVELLVSHMRRAGFSAARITMIDSGGIGWNKFGWQYSLKNLSQSDFLKGFLFVLGSVLARIMTPFEENDRAGTAYTIVFTKER